MSTNPSPFGSGGGGTQPYQFQPETYGAKGNGRMVGDLATNGTTTVTSATAAFTTADQGKTIMINGGNGTAAQPFTGTISTVTNATTAVLSAAPSATASNCAAVWGTDDTSAINQALAAASTYAQANQWRAQVIFGAKIYLVGTAGPTQTTVPAVQNAVLTVPYGPVNNANQKLTIELIGAGDNGALQYFSTAKPTPTGTVIVSVDKTAPNTPSGTFGRQSVIGGPSGGAAFTGSFANLHVKVDGIAVYVPILCSSIAYDFGFTSGITIGQASANTFAPAQTGGAHPILADLPPLVAFQSNVSVGLRSPLVGNNDDVNVTRFTAQGYETGVWIADHFAALSLVTMYVDLGILFDLVNGISGSGHLAAIKNWSIEQYNGGLRCNGGGTGFAPVDITMDTETIGGAGDPLYDVNDNGNMFGVMRITDAGGRTARRPLVSNGAPNLRIVNDMMGPGPWLTANPAVPAVPASTVTAQNVSWRNATVTVACPAGVTVSVVQVGGTTTGQTIAASSQTTVRVPSGKTIALTYAGGTPTWQWVLD